MEYDSCEEAVIQIRLRATHISSPVAQLGRSDRLLTDRSLVRPQVGEPPTISKESS